MTQIRERLIDVGRARVWVGDSGAGAPVILSNGGPGCCDYLEPVADMIDDLTHVYRWEQRGCGRSDHTGPYDIKTVIGDMESLRVTLGHDRWIVGGHSWGANLAHAYALAFPHRVSGLIYLSGTGIDHDWREGYQRNKAGRSEQLPEFAYPFNREVNRVGNQSHRVYLNDPALIERTKQSAMPALIVHGGEDLRPPVSARRVADWMSNAEFVPLPGAEHYLWLTHKNELRTLMCNWLGRTLDPV